MAPTIGRGMLQCQGNYTLGLRNIIFFIWPIDVNLIWFAFSLHSEGLSCTLSKKYNRFAHHKFIVLVTDFKSLDL